MSKKVKCCECDSFMGWALPRGVDKDNYEYAKEVLKLASTTGICEYTMKTKARSHEQYCRKFKKDKFLERHNDFFKDEILKLENMIKEYEKRKFCGSRRIMESSFYEKISRGEVDGEINRMGKW